MGLRGLYLTFTRKSLCLKILHCAILQLKTAAGYFPTSPARRRSRDCQPIRTKAWREDAFRDLSTCWKKIMAGRWRKKTAARKKKRVCCEKKKGGGPAPPRCYF